MPDRSRQRSAAPGAARRVVVIGSGPVGAVAVRRLAESGCETTLIEAGERVLLPDLPGARPGEHVRNQPILQRQPDAFQIEALSRLTFYDLSAPPEGLPGASETIAFGGQGLIWTNNCPRTQAGLDRPPGFDDDTWERRYVQAEGLLSVTTDPLGHSERQTRVAGRLTTHLTGSGRRVERLPIAGRADGDAIHYTATADILAGIAATAPSLEIRCGTRAVRIEHGSRRATSVCVATATGEERLEADALVVAAGVFATPRLLFASDLRLPALGRWLHYHPLLLAQLVLDEELSAPAGRADPPPRLWIPPTRRAPWHAMVLRDLGAGLPEEPVEERRLIELQFFAPVEPRAEHCMRLDGTVPRFDVRLSERDRATLDAMRVDAEAVGRALGRWRKGCEPSWNPWGFSHPMGTTRMGDDPATSVVDRYGRVHGMENLYVAGISLLPGPMAVNPTLTAVALALEMVDALVRAPA